MRCVSNALRLRRQERRHHSPLQPLPLHLLKLWWQDWADRQPFSGTRQVGCKPTSRKVRDRFDRLLRHIEPVSKLLGVLPNEMAIQSAQVWVMIYTAGHLGFKERVILYQRATFTVGGQAGFGNPSMPQGLPDPGRGGWGTRHFLQCSWIP